MSTLAIHFDLFNGQVAFIKLDEIEDDSVNWITRLYLELIRRNTKIYRN